MKTINYKTIEKYARKIEKQNLTNHGKSLCFSSMLNDVPIKLVYHDSNLVDVDDDWKNSIDRHLI